MELGRFMNTVMNFRSLNKILRFFFVAELFHGGLHVQVILCTEINHKIVNNKGFSLWARLSHGLLMEVAVVLNF
jgi:hypothetical protein